VVAVWLHGWRSAGRSNRQHTFFVIVVVIVVIVSIGGWLFTFCNGFMEYSIGTGGWLGVGGFVRLWWQKVWFIGGLSGIDD
jgi:hypothetical protein